jgi:myo-inositol-1(or 4)-monophosphatase
MDLPALQHHAIQAALLAGKIIKEGMENRAWSVIGRKKETDFVTSVDYESESAILKYLQQHCSDISILTEESGDSGERKDFRWIIDPLDGTTNFLHGFPWVAVSIALEQCAESSVGADPDLSGSCPSSPFGEPVMGVVYNPFTEDLFTARRNEGAYRNGKQIHISEVQSLKDALLGTGYPFRNREIIDEYLKIFRELFSCCHGIRRAGSAALDFSWLAAGAFDGFWEYGLSPWDMAAGAVLIREAGGVVTDFDGGDHWLETGNIVAGTPGVHPEILKVIQIIRDY